MSNKKRMTAIAVVAFALVAVVSARIAYVNYDVPHIIEEHYSVGEWVELDGAFLSSIQENTEGYSLRVVSAELMSYNDYIRRYGQDPSAVVEGLDSKSVIALEMEVENEGNEEGAIFLFECKLVPARGNEYFTRDSALWIESERQMEGTVALYLSLVEGTSYTTVIPYTINSIDEEGLSQYKATIEDSSFGLVVSNHPTRKIIDISICSE